MKRLIQFVARSLVREPDKVQVEETRGNRRARYVLHVAKSDMGRIIGKNGRTAKAMRTVITAVAARDRQRVTIDIAD